MALTQASEGGLKISNAGTNGQFLQKQSGNTGGLTWATPSTGGGSGTDYDDNVKVKFGTGDDLEIYHDGSDSYIKNSTGNFQLTCDEFRVRTVTGTETVIQASVNGDTQLYYDNSKKLHTTSTGVDVTGQLVTDGASHAGDVIFQGDNANSYWDKSADDLIFNDSAAVCIGTSSDLKLYHDGTHSHITNSTGWLKITESSSSGGIQYAASNHQWNNQANDEAILYGYEDGAVKFYYDGALKAETNAQGVIVGGDVDNSTGTQGVALQTGGKIRSRVANTSADAFIVSVDGSGASKAVINGAGNGLFNGGLDVPDSAKIQLGDGDDLEIYHNGTLSRIDNNTGDLLIRTNVASDVGGNIYLKPHDDEDGIIITHDAGVELYYNGSKKLETIAGGVTVTGNIETNEHISLTGDNKKLKFGASEDLQIYHDGSHSYITSSTGDFTIDSDGDDLVLQSSDDILIRPQNGENGIYIYGNGAAELYYDNSKKFETASYGVGLTGNVRILNDNDSLQLGAGQDLKLYHDGGGSYLTNSTGILMIQGKAGENSIRCHPDAQVELYYDHSIKLSTTSAGADVTGELGINVSSPQNPLHVKNSTNNPTYVRIQRGAGETSNGNAYSGIIFDGHSYCGAKIASHRDHGTYDDRGDLRFFSGYGDDDFTERFRIANNGDLTGTDTSISSNSDQRLKTNIKDFTYDLAKFKQFKPKTFDWRNPVQHGEKTGQRGFLAQDIESIDNYLIGEYIIDKDDPDRSLVDSDGKSKTSRLGKNDAMYISIIQQLITKIETLETKVAALEAG